MANRQLFPTARAGELARSGQLIQDELNIIQAWLNETVQRLLTASGTLPEDVEDGIWVELSRRLADSYVTRATLGHPISHETGRLVEKLHMWEQAGLRPSAVLERTMEKRLQDMLNGGSTSDDEDDADSSDDGVVVIAHFEDGSSSVMHNFDDCQVLEEDAEYDGRSESESEEADAAGVLASTGGAWAAAVSDLANRPDDDAAMTDTEVKRAMPRGFHDEDL